MRVGRGEGGSKVCCLYFLSQEGSSTLVGLAQSEQWREKRLTRAGLGWAGCLRCQVRPTTLIRTDAGILHTTSNRQLHAAYARQQLPFNTKARR